MTDLETTVARKIVGLQQVFAEHETFEKLQKEFQRMLERRRAAIEVGDAFEARGIAVIGPSGSGKTRAVQRVFSHTPGLVIDDPRTARTEVVSFLVPAPATLKFVGARGLRAVGYQLNGNKTEMAIWDLFRQHLQARGTLFLHLDEAQDLRRRQKWEAVEPVIRTLKSLMQTQVWPVGLVLSGMPELKDLINHDPQLARRLIPIEFPGLVPGIDNEQVLGLTRTYMDRACLVANDHFDNDFAARLIHSADRQFGRLTEIVIEAIETALLLQANEVGYRHFAAAYQRRTGCRDALNPFLANDFTRINTSMLLEHEARK
jgi:type II secretory pathway predicted ATPase ExeA